MAQHQYYPEEVLIEKMQSGEYGWLDYVNMPVTVRNATSLSGMILPPNLSATRTNSWKRRWRKETHSG
jgi:hypothetical protein